MSSSKRTSVKDIAITQSIAVVVFVIVPIVLTLMAPLSEIRFEKSETGLAATVVRYVLIFLPWRTENIDRVSGVRADITEAKRYRGTLEERRKGQRGTQLATGQVAILHDGPEVIVQAAPDLANQIVKEFDEYKVANSTEPLTCSVYASWSLSYIVGGIATAFCALYIFGATIATILFPFKLMRRSSSTTSMSQ